jgi:hypothetical protein
MRAKLAGPCLAAALVGVAFAGPAFADAVKVTPRLTAFTKENAPRPPDAAPTVLRGDATRRGTVDGRYGAFYEPSRFQLGAGAKLWLTDPVSGAVAVCEDRRTSRVGGRVIRCIEGYLPYSLYE